MHGPAARPGRIPAAQHAHGKGALRLADHDLGHQRSDVGGAFLETLPLYEDGPGNGKWNLGQYVVARGSDLPLHDLEVEVLPPVDANEKPKGMAEVVMIPIVAALLNAIFDATGHRFQSVPVTQAMLKGAIK